MPITHPQMWAQHNSWPFSQQAEQLNWLWDKRDREKKVKWWERDRNTVNSVW